MAIDAEVRSKIDLALGELSKVKNETGGKEKMLQFVVIGEDELLEGDVQPLQTGHISMDLSIGIGGIPKGKIIEFNGGEGSFKSATAWSICGQVQKSGGLIAWLDAENAVDFRIPKFRKFLRLLGVDVESVLLLRPDTAEQGFKMVQALAKAGSVDLIVWDSIIALSNDREESADMEKTDRLTLPATINKGLRKTAGYLRKSDCTLILINQQRQNMDAVGPYAKKWTTTGGKGLKHWLSLQISFWSKKIKDSNKRVIGYEIHGKIDKTRFDNEREETIMFFYVNQGFDNFEELFNLATSYGVMKKSGNNYSWEGHEDEYEKMSASGWRGLFTGVYDYSSMNKNELSDLALEMELVFKKNISKDDLIELIQSSEPVLDEELNALLVSEVIEAYESFYNPDEIERDLEEMEDEEDYDFSTMTLEELKELADEWELPYKPKDKKPALIGILEEYWYSEEEEGEDE